MKELSIEEKVRRYDEAIEKAKVFKRHLLEINEKDYADEIDYIFPELAESDDERIRKELIEFVKSRGGFKQEYIAWLEIQGEHANFRNNIQIGDKVTRNEDGVLVNLSQLKRVAKKQGEQKLYVNDNAKEMFIKALERVEEQNNKGYKLTDCDKNSWWEDFKAYTSCTIEQKPAAWSDEDEKQARQIERIVHDDGCTQKLQKQIADWLKSLKERYTWKPSDEQMEALNYVVNLMASSESLKENDYYYNVFKGLREQLKKL